MFDSIKKVFMLFNKREKNKLLLIFFMMIFAALLETVSIGIIVPVVGIVTNPTIVQENKYLSIIYETFDFQSYAAFIVLTVVVLLLVFVFKNLYILFYNYIQYRIVLNQQVRLSTNLFREYLIKPYTFHLQRNTAELLRNVNGEVSKVFQGILLASFQLITEILITVSILILLIAASPIATLVAITLLGASILLFFKIFKGKISQLGKEQQFVTSEIIKWVNQGLGASKEVKVSGKEAFFINSYRKYSLIGVKNSRFMKMLELVPRVFIETLLVATVLITMLIIVFQGNNTTQLISTMALFAMSAFRLMPSITRIIALLTSIKYNQAALNIVYEDLIKYKDKPIINDDEKSSSIVLNEKVYTKSIEIKNVYFQYINQKDYTIRDLTLTIPIGKSVAFIGESGAGKSTIIDIILGLLEPDRGEVFIDGKRLSEQMDIWQEKIGYIPQAIFLSDDTIRNNVAFGYDAILISDEEVWRALEQAQLKEFVESLPNQLDTSVGERGVRLSGGQRQRIGIARALYHNPEILFMDEATSALDNETEKEIMRSIDGLKGEKTIIIIAHRLTTIENCDIIFKINKGKLVAIENKVKQSVI